MTALNIIFAGTPDFAAEHLQALIESPHNICAVYTQPDRPKGRGKRLLASPVKQLALDNDLPVFQPTHLKDDAEQQQLRRFGADIMVVVAYGLILPKAVLEIPSMGCVNVHGSLLPRWRGAAPIERAIEAGDKNTGICLMQMDVGLDDGPVLLSAETPIEDEDTGDSLRSKLAVLGSKVLIDGLEKLSEAQLIAQQQNHEQANYAHKLNKQEALIDWNQDARCIALKIRAFNSMNPCYTLLNGERIKLWMAKSSEQVSTNNYPSGSIVAQSKHSINVACQNSVLEITRMQLPNGRAMDVRDILNGHAQRFAVGVQFDLPTTTDNAK